MRQQTHHVLIGLFVILAAALAVGGALFLGAGSFGRNALVLETYIEESVTGLDVGAHVRFRGVKLGSVTEISWTSLEYDTTEPLVLVRFTIQPVDGGITVDQLSKIVSQRLENGLRARLASAGLTGALYLEADLYDDADTRYPPLPHDWTPRYRYIPSIPSTINQIASSAEALLANLQTADFAGVIAEARDALRDVRGIVNSLDVQGLRQRADGLIDELSGFVNRSSAAVDSVGAGVEELVARARERVVAIDSGQLLSLVTDLRQFTQRLEPTRLALDALLVEGSRAAAGLSTTLRSKNRDLDAILRAVRQTMTSMSGLASTLEEYPSLLLLGNPPPARDPGRSR